MIKKKQLPHVFPVLLIPIISLTACFESKWEQMPDDELAAKSAECMAVNHPGPAMVQVCENVKRECERRRKDGIFVC